MKPSLGNKLRSCLRKVYLGLFAFASAHMCVMLLTAVIHQQLLTEFAFKVDVSTVS